MKKAAILGEGITGRAVSEKLSEMGYMQTSVAHADIVVTSPGIPSSQFPETDKEIISEIEFCYRFFQKSKTPPTLIGVTGTNGKSTVTALLAHILEAPYAGNIGIPLVTFVGQHVPLIVVELSSYQLEFCTHFRPDIAIMLNLAPDHLERHKTMRVYAEQKAKIFQSQTPYDVLIYWEEDPYLPSLVCSAHSEKIGFSSRHAVWGKLNHLPIVGNHNRLNALAAYLAAQRLGVSETDILLKMQTFKPLEHRIEPVLVWEGRAFYNDSKGTNPESTAVAVQAFQKPIQLILGGKDKHLELEGFLNFIVQKVKSIVVYGEIAQRVFFLVKAISPDYPIFLFSTLDLALQKSVSCSQSGDVILFSPACSSFDQFKDFNHRGEVFKSLVNQYYGNH